MNLVPQPAPPVPPSETGMDLGLSEDPWATTHRVVHSHRLPSLPTEQLDGQIDNTPSAATTRQRSSAANQVLLLQSLCFILPVVKILCFQSKS